MAPHRENLSNAGPARQRRFGSDEKKDLYELQGGTQTAPKGRKWAFAVARRMAWQQLIELSNFLIWF